MLFFCWSFASATRYSLGLRNVYGPVGMCRVHVCTCRSLPKTSLIAIVLSVPVDLHKRKEQCQRRGKRDGSRRLG